MCRGTISEKLLNQGQERTIVSCSCHMRMNESEETNNPQEAFSSNSSKGHFKKSI
jgi:hypothetical protein